MDTGRLRRSKNQYSVRFEGIVKCGEHPLLQCCFEIDEEILTAHEVLSRKRRIPGSSLRGRRVAWPWLTRSVVLGGMT